MTTTSIPAMDRPATFKYEGFISGKVIDNSSLLEFLSNNNCIVNFEKSSYVRASHSYENFQYVTWQIKRNQSYCRFVQQMGDLVLFQVSQSNRYYLISEKTGTAVSIEYRSK
jgi:hypothetical protein